MSGITTPNIVISLKTQPDGAPDINLAAVHQTVAGAEYNKSNGCYIRLMLNTGDPHSQGRIVKAHLYRTGVITLLGNKTVEDGRLFMYSIVRELNRVNALIHFANHMLVPREVRVVNLLRKWELGFEIDIDKLKLARNKPKFAEVSINPETGNVMLLVMLSDNVTDVKLQAIPTAGVLTILRAYSEEQLAEIVEIVTPWVEKARVSKPEPDEAHVEIPEDFFFAGTMEILAAALRGLEL